MNLDELLEIASGLRIEDMPIGKGHGTIHAKKILVEADGKMMEENGYSLAFYAADQYLKEKRSIREICTELGIKRRALEMVLSYAGAERRDAVEAKRMAGFQIAQKQIGVHGASLQQRREWGNKGAEKTMRAGSGIFALTPAQRSEHSKRNYPNNLGKMSPGKRYGACRKAGLATQANGTGIFSLSKDQRVAISRRVYEEGKGIAAQTEAEHLEASRAGGLATHTRRVGYFGLTDEERRKAGAEGGRISVEKGLGVHNPDKKNDYLATVHGPRTDVPFDARSTYEANIYRLLKYFELDVMPHAKVTLETSGSMLALGQTDFTIDFCAKSLDGVMVYLEIIAAPQQQRLKFEKIRLFREQKADRLILITTALYDDLASTYSSHINAASDGKGHNVFAGWETKKHNLRTHPEIYS